MNNALIAMATTLLLAALALWLSDAQVELFLLLNQASSQLPDWLWANLTLLADTLWAVAALLIAASFRPQLFVKALLTFLLGALIVHLAKAGFDASRPALVLGKEAFHIIGPTLKHHSFPSGHAFTAMATAGLLALTFPRAAIAILTIGALAAFSRIAVGAHWPLDVLVGGGLGLLTAVVGVQSANKIALFQHNGWRMAALVLLTLATIALIFHDDRYPMTQALTVLSALVALAISVQRMWWPLMRLIRQTDRS